MGHGASESARERERERDRVTEEAGVENECHLAPPPDPLAVGTSRGGAPIGGRRAGQPESESAPDFWGGGSGEEELEE